MERLKFSLLSVMSVLLFTLSSCCDDNDDYMVATFSFSCSPDLLDFVIPTVHYWDNNGVQKNITLKKDDFKTISKGSATINTTINGVKTTTTKEFIDNYWKFKKRYDGLEAKDKIWVTYELKDENVINPDKVYSFYHGFFNSEWYVYLDDSLVKIYEKSSMPEEVDISCEANVQEYLCCIANTTVIFNVDLVAKSK